MRRGGTWIAAGLAVLVLVVGLGPVARAEEPASPAAPGAALVDVCVDLGLPELPQIGAGTCKSLDAVAVLLAVVCGTVVAVPAICNDLTDGRPTDPAAVDAFEGSWVHRALGLQARLDDDLPLRDALIPHTHNSFNSGTEWPSLTTSDPNHRYSMTDQLRMGIRAIELDVHFLPHPGGDPAQALREPVLCHGQTERIGPLSLHVGCTIDRPLDDGLEEIRAWLDAPGNEQEVLLVYLQNELDGEELAHERVVAQLNDAFGSLVARPQASEPGVCEDLPLDRSRADLRAEGHRVLLVGNCGPGAWSSWVFQRGDGWDERSNAAGYPAFPACQADRAERGYDDHLIRVTEDQTWLSAIAGSAAPISEAEVRAMVRCGVELIGLDRIGPADPRLAALVWSWAPDEPSDAGPCGRWGTDARFRASGCEDVLRVACRTAAGGWVVPQTTTAFAGAFGACVAAGASFDVPRTGWDDELLRTAAAGAGELWLNLGHTAASGWQPGLASAAALTSTRAVIDTSVAGPGPAPRHLPSTGGSVTWLPLAAAALALVLLSRRALATR